MPTQREADILVQDFEAESEAEWTDPFLLARPEFARVPGKGVAGAAKGVAERLALRHRFPAGSGESGQPLLPEGPQCLDRFQSVRKGHLLYITERGQDRLSRGEARHGRIGSLWG